LRSSDESWPNVYLTQEPYPHAVVEEMLGSETTAAVCDWLSHEAVWIAERTSLYAQYRCANIIELLFANAVLPDNVLASIGCHIGRLFGDEIDESRIEIAAHKLVTGCQIGVHTDEPKGSTESHRALITFQNSDELVRGGELMLLPASVRGRERKLPPHNGVGILMKLSARSLHAVRPVASGVRYSVVLSYWTSQHRTSRTVISQAVRRIPEDLTTSFTKLIRAHHVHSSRHATHNGDRVVRPLADHLVGTYEVLRSWGCDKDTCAAGLFHGIYGPPGIGTALVPLSDRQILRDEIGRQAEQLVYLFSALDRSSDQEISNSVFAVKLLGRTSSVELPASVVALVFLLSWASLREQIPHVRLSVAEASELIGRLTMFEAHLPRRAIEDLHTAFALMSR